MHVHVHVCALRMHCACTAGARHLRVPKPKPNQVRGTCVYLSIHTMALGVSLSPRCTALEPTHLPLAWACSFESTPCMKPLTLCGREVAWREAQGAAARVQSAGCTLLPP